MYIVGCSVWYILQAPFLHFRLRLVVPPYRKWLMYVSFGYPCQQLQNTTQYIGHSGVMSKWIQLYYYLAAYRLHQSHSSISLSLEFQLSTADTAFVPVVVWNGTFVSPLYRTITGWGDWSWSGVPLSLEYLPVASGRNLKYEFGLLRKYTVVLCLNHYLCVYHFVILGYVCQCKVMLTFSAIYIFSSKFWTLGIPHVISAEKCANNQSKSTGLQHLTTQPLNLI